MQRKTLVGAAVLAVGLLPGCGLGADAADQTAPAPATTTTTPTVSGPAGTPHPDALSDFRCEPDAAGAWSALGTVTNEAAAPADYLVTVVLAGATDESASGKRQLIPDLASGETYDLRLNRLPVPAGEAVSCQVQVLRR